jgi:hypothetical protein
VGRGCGVSRRRHGAIRPAAAGVGRLRGANQD